MNMKNKDYKQSKRYKLISERVEQNIRLICENQEIDKFINKQRNRYPGLVDLFNDIFGSMDPFLPNYIQFETEEGKTEEAKIEPMKNMDEIISYMLSYKYRDEYLGQSDEYPEESKFLQEINSFSKDSEIIKICDKLKVSPALWREVIKAKLIGIEEKNLLSFIDYISENYYAPKIKIKNDGLYIKINEATTIEDIKMIWPEIKEQQDTMGKNYKTQIRKYSNIERDKRACELKNEGKKWKDIIKILQKEGYKCTDSYSDASQMKRVRKKRKLEI